LAVRFDTGATRVKRGLYLISRISLNPVIANSWRRSRDYAKWRRFGGLKSRIQNLLRYGSVSFPAPFWVTVKIGEKRRRWKSDNQTSVTEMGEIVMELLQARI
jgi:hypothetical protein